MWVYVKNIVYQSPFAGIGDRKKHITDVIMTFNADMLFRTWQELKY